MLLGNLGVLAKLRLALYGLGATDHARLLGAQEGMGPALSLALSHLGQIFLNHSHLQVVLHDLSLGKGLPGVEISSSLLIKEGEVGLSAHRCRK